MAPKKRGPAPTGIGTSLNVCVQPDLLNDIDLWISAQDDEPSRPEAIRRLVKFGLKKTVLRVQK